MATYLHRTQTAGTNTKIWTFSTWLKKASVSNDQVIFKSYSSASDHIYVRFNSNNDMYMESATGGVSKISFTTNRKFRDISGWMHVCLKVDMTQATSTDRWKLFINGVDEASVGGYSSSNYASQNDNLEMNTVGAVMYIGANQSPSEYFYGAHAHTHLIDGTAYDASAFGETDSTSGIWKPKTSPSVTYGNNGFFLKYASGASGTDSSGEGNNMTVVGNLTNNKDTPHNNFCTINALDGYYFNGTFTNGNNTVATHAGNENYTTSTIWLGAGRWYWEVLVDSEGGGSDVGYIDKITSATSNYLGQGSGCAWRWDGNLRINNSYATGTFATFTTGDYLGFYLDLEDNKIYIAKNGTILNSGTGITITAPASVASGTGLYTPAFGDEHSSSSTYSTNFGNGVFGSTQLTGTTYSDNDSIGTFKYSPNDGGAASFDSSAKNFYAICTKNIKSYGG